MDGVVTEADTAAKVELRDRLLPINGWVCFGLPVHCLEGTADLDRDADLEGLPFNLRSGVLVPLMVPARPTAFGTGLPLVPRLSNAALMSAGIGTWCTTLTDLQSAGGISLCSAGVGALQQPGQPALAEPACLGLARAHWEVR